MCRQDFRGVVSCPNAAVWIAIAIREILTPIHFTPVLSVKILTLAP